MKTQPRLAMTSVSIAVSVAMMVTSVTSAAATGYTNTSQTQASYATSANSTSANDGSGRLAVSTFGNGQVPAEATTQEAVAAASLPSNSVINTTRPYQDVNTVDTMFGEQLFRGAFSTTSGSTFNDSYSINPGDNVQVRMWGAYQYAATMTVDPQGNIFLPM